MDEVFGGHVGLAVLCAVQFVILAVCVWAFARWWLTNKRLVGLETELGKIQATLQYLSRQELRRRATVRVTEAELDPVEDRVAPAPRTASTSTGQ